MTVYELRFDYDRPPLTLNQRLHWARKASITRLLRGETKLRAKQAGIPPMNRREVTLVWFVNTNHRRDVDNAVATLKVMCDGLVDAGIVPDDTPEYMVKNMPILGIESPRTLPKPYLLLRVVDLTESDAA